MTVLSNTGVFERFPAAMGQPTDSGRRALVTLGHFVALVVAVVAISATTLSSILGTDSTLASKPAVLGAYILTVYVSAGIVRGRFVYTGYGFAFVGGLVAFMAIGQLAVGDAVFPGWLYLGFAVVVAFVSGVVWLDVRLNGRPV